MRKQDIHSTADLILQKLQKRDAVFVDLPENVSINNLSFTPFQFYMSVATVLSSKHFIPLNYLHYYFRSQSKESKSPTKAQVALMRKLLKDFKPGNQLLAGGSFAKTYIDINQTGQRYVIKSATGGAANKLKNELNLLQKLSKDKNFSKHIPKQTGCEEREETFSFGLKYYPLETLSYKILFGKFDTKEAHKVVTKVLDKVSKHLWSKEREAIDSTYINNFFLKRIESNTDQLLELAPSLEWLIKPPELIINNKKYINLLSIVKHIRNNKKAIGLLVPPFTSLVWGDLHPNNILIDKDNFILIDARGDKGDYLYDLGKMHHTFGPGRYDFLDNDLYALNVSKNNNIYREFLTEHPAWDTYNEIETIFNKALKKYRQKEDKHFDFRWKFINFCMYATMPPFLVKGRIPEERAIMGYTNAVILGNTFLEKMERYAK